MKPVFLALTLACSTLAAGCAGHFAKPKPAPTPRPNHVAIHGDANLTDVQPIYRREGDLVYHIVAGEMAGYEGDMALAVKNYLEAARLSAEPAVAERATRIALFAHDYSHALSAAERWAQLAPKAIDAHRILGVLYLREGKVDLAVDAFDRSLALTGGNVDQGFYLISRILAREDDHKGALAVMQGLVKRHDADAAAHFAFAQLAAQFESYDQALAQAERALALKPGWADAGLLRARIQMEQGHTEAALNGMKALVDARPESRELRVSYARLLAEAHRFDDASHQFEILLKKNPRDSELLYAMSLLAIEGKRYDLAESYLKRLLRTGKRNDDAYYYLGAIAEAKGRNAQAIKDYSRVNHGDRRVDAHIRVSILMAKGGDLAGARKHLHSVRPTSPASAVRFFIADADLLRDAGKPGEAMKVLDHALAQLPGNHDLLYARALLAESMDRLDQCEADLKQILAADPDNAQALNALGYTLADRTDRYKEALTYIQHALELSPDEPAILDSMGWVQYRLGNLEQALVYLRKAYKGDPDPEVAAHLGEVLWVSGDRDAANEVWDEALKKDPQNKSLLKVIKRFRK